MTALTTSPNSLKNALGTAEWYTKSHLPVGLAHPFFISLSGPFYPRHMDQDSSEGVSAKALSTRSYARFPGARFAKWAH